MCLRGGGEDEVGWWMVGVREGVWGGVLWFVGCGWDGAVGVRMRALVLGEGGGGLGS